jgi:integrase
VTTNRRTSSTAGPAGSRWSYSTGERGVNRVRAIAHPLTGRCSLEYYEPSTRGDRPRPRRVALGHTDRERAKAAAEALAAELRSAGAGRATVGPVTLGTLFDIYLREVTPTKGEQKQHHDRECARLFLEAFGDRPAATLSRREWDRFIRDRRSGVLRPSGSKQRRVVRDRVVGYDLRFLLAVLNWATVSSDNRGGALLDRNPLKGLTVPREESPRRPVLESGQYTALLAVASDVHPLFRLALELAHETGHRIGAIRLLRWSDVDTARRLIRWRGENDKIGYEHATPLTAGAVAALEAERRRVRAIGDAWLFANPAAKGAPWRRENFRAWWRRGVARAELTLDARAGWHSLRRQFANELRETNLKDLCALGGWKSAQTVLTCYQQPDQQVMRAALERRAGRGA